MATANQIRQVAIEVKENTATLKAAVDAFKALVDAIDAITSLWVVNSDDASLPAEADVKAQLEAYEALSTSSVTGAKASNVISDSISAVKAAV